MIVLRTAWLTDWKPSKAVVCLTKCPITSLTCTSISLPLVIFPFNTCLIYFHIMWKWIKIYWENFHYCMASALQDIDGSSAVFRNFSWVMFCLVMQNVYQNDVQHILSYMGKSSQVTRSIAVDSFRPVIRHRTLKRWAISFLFLWNFLTDHCRLAHLKWAPKVDVQDAS